MFKKVFFTLVVLSLTISACGSNQSSGTSLSIENKSAVDLGDEQLQVPPLQEDEQRGQDNGNPPPPQEDGQQGQNNGNPPAPQDGSQQGQGSGSGYNVEQAISDHAQLTTIAFDALAFLTGDQCTDTFLPPSKIADFFGFQYLRDNDSGQLGHNTSFLPLAANNVLYILTDEQIGQLISLAEEQTPLIEEYGYQRFTLMDAFRRQLEGQTPSDSANLSAEAVMDYSATLFRLDGEISLRRAQVLGEIVRTMTPNQIEAMQQLTATGSEGWSDVGDQVDKQSMSHEMHVAVMTYASQLFSWYAGSIEADTYFCPERHGTYFGSFYLKDIPAMGNPGYSISTSLTGDAGESLLNLLDEIQRALITDLVNLQSESLREIVTTREQIATELRQLMTQENIDTALVLQLSERYGELDGYISYLYATNFAEVYKSLTPAQQAELDTLRTSLEITTCSGAYLYSDNIPMPIVDNTNFMFK